MAARYALAALSAGVATAQLQGFNYGAQNLDNSAKTEAQFEAEFSAAQNLPNAPGFNSARLYSMIQWNTANDVIQGIPAAIATNTSLLLGLWASGGAEGFANELVALNGAIEQYGSDFTDLVVGISCGSEDLYRISPTGIENESGPGAGPDTLVDYIQQLRAAIEDTPLAGQPIGHVDTWTAWVNGSNAAVIENVDFIGFNAFPYFENTEANSIDNAASLFQAALAATQGVSAGTPIWITEVGWPVSGATENEAVPSTENAEQSWREVTCPLLGEYNVWAYVLRDQLNGTPDVSFGVLADTNQAPLYDLSCPATSGDDDEEDDDVEVATTSAVVATTPATGNVTEVSEDTAATVFPTLAPEDDVTTTFIDPIFPTGEPTGPVDDSDETPSATAAGTSAPTTDGPVIQTGAADKIGSAYAGIIAMIGMIAAL